jgi:hypothetical protein
MQTKFEANGLARKRQELLEKDVLICRTVATQSKALDYVDSRCDVPHYLSYCGQEFSNKRTLASCLFAGNTAEFRNSPQRQFFDSCH